LATERIEGDDNVWTRRLVLFLRIMAVLSVLKGLYHWAQGTGFIGGEEGAFEKQPKAWQGAPGYFALIELGAGVRLSLPPPLGRGGGSGARDAGGRGGGAQDGGVGGGDGADVPGILGRQPARCGRRSADAAPLSRACRDGSA